MSIRGCRIKALTCDLCNYSAAGVTFEDRMNSLMLRCVSAHADIMKDPGKGDAERAQWMADNKARFDACWIV